MSIETIKVAPSELDGWDVVREGEDVALTNLATKQEAEQAAHVFAEEDGHHAEIEVSEEPLQHGVGGEQRGVRTYFVALVGLLAAITALIVVISLVSSALNI
jgi:hypothetical protein